MRAVLFDLDGVLIDSYQVWFHVVNAAARALGYPAISAEVYHECWGQGLEADQERFFPRHTMAAIEACYVEEFPRQLAHIQVMPAAAPVLAEVRRRGLGSAVVTNGQRALALLAIERAGLVPDLLVGADDVAHAKPAPDMLLRACEQLGVGTADVLMVGDSRFDREAARAARVRFAGLGIDGDLRLARLEELLDYLPG